MAKADIWCEVICSNCGGMVGRFYKNRDSIRKLKEETKDWTQTNGDNLCPECTEQMKKVGE